MKSGAFLFEKVEFDSGSGLLRMHYRYENGPVFEERIAFPPPTRNLSQNDHAALDASFRLLFLFAGASYYKAFVPDELRCPAFALDAETAEFVEKVYRKGLAEFAFRNNLDLGKRIKIAHANAPPRAASPLNLKRRSLLPVGGGKDSIVSLECLKEGGEPFALFALGSTNSIAVPIEATIKQSGLTALRIHRTISPELLKLNESGAYNGHVPITAILSAIAVAAALMHDFDAVILSNEHSASAPNVWMDQQEINHQYSKSFDFENDFSSYVSDHIASDLHYFSLLRAFSEADIARRFAQHDEYDSIFRSCNKAFKQDETERATQWCGDCPKCRFVFMALAPVMDKARLIGIFGKNLLADKNQEEGFAELCGLVKHKPFECVGETGESALLMGKLARSSEWSGEAVVASLAKKLHTADEFERLYDELFAPREDHNIPERYLRMLHADHRS